MIEVTRHFEEDVAEMSTRCGLTLMKDRPDDDTSLDINDCTCPRCLRLVIFDLTRRLHVTHFVEDVAEITTVCGLNSMKDRPDEDTSIDINNCTCLQCLNLIIGDRIKRFHNIIVIT